MIENNKPILVIECPCGTRSGYGERSRDLIRALIALDKYDIKIVSTRWGNTPMNALTEKDEDIYSRLLTQNLAQQPEIYVQVTVPNEFRKMGKYNIGVTAGIETTVCDASWLEGCNRMDLVLVSSKHAKDVFEKTTYDKLDQNNQLLGQLKLTTPVEVLFEGVRLDKFTKTYVAEPGMDSFFKGVKEDFAFLFCGHWLQGEFGEDRKNVSGLIKTFLESFKGKQNAPALILKVSGGNPSIVDRDDILRKIEVIKSTVDSKILPSIYLAYGDFTDEEMNALYNHPKVKVHVSFTKGEGYGRPLAEAAVTAKPIIASKWSGHLDFLSSETSVLVDGTLTNIHPSAQWKGVLNEGSQWFSIDFGQASAYMKDMFKDYKTYAERSRKTYHHMKTNFSFEAMKTKLSEYMSRVPEFPKAVQLKLPQLKKVELPKLKKIENNEAK
jgi:glycosyltransferase involved in cell wall biosynthesis